VFHAGEDLMSLSGSASDLLQNIPSIQVDIDGNISLRGSEDVHILICKKRSVRKIKKFRHLSCPDMIYVFFTKNPIMLS
jgi:hypothetical protein